ncbi:MAG TPA: carboxypeptidase regulatory-like domain-containing protein [Armatimonadota bacterium]|jgi:hypothetical protein
MSQRYAVQHVVGIALLVLAASGWANAQSTSTITGHVVTADSKKPIAGCNVVGYDVDSGSIAQGITDALGRFQITVVYTGTCRVCCTAQGFNQTSETAYLRSGGTVDMHQIEMDPAHGPESLSPSRYDRATTTGRVVDGETQRPIAAAKVVLVNNATNNAVSEGLTDSDGWYRFTNLPVVTYHACFTAVYYNQSSTSIYTSEGMTSKESDQAMDRAHGTDPSAPSGYDLSTISWRLVSQRTDAPIANAMAVIVDSRSGAVAGHATTDSDGWFRIAGLPGTLYSTRLTAQGYNQASHSAYTSQGSTELRPSVELVPARGRDALTPGDGLSCTVTGQVMDASSKLAVADATIDITDAGSNQQWHGLADHQGWFRFVGLPESVLRVSASAQGYGVGDSTAYTSDGETNHLNIRLAANGDPTATKSPWSELDMNGDGAEDFLWRNPSSGSLALWLTHPAVAQAALPLAAPSWKLVGTGDFSGEGMTDLLWRDPSTGQNGIWTFASANVDAYVSIIQADPQWSVAGIRDFDGDGTDDILWRSSRTGGNSVWFMHAGVPVEFAPLPSVDLGWQVAGVGDFNGDGTGDILWHHSAGPNAVWLMKGAQVAVGTALPSTAQAWGTPVGVGDFDGDGKSDILWRNSVSGGNAIWFMNGDSPKRYALTTPAGLNWRVLRAADYNGDGKCDILWHEDATGANGVWLMSGEAIQGLQQLPSTGPEWSLVPAR